MAENSAGSSTGSHRNGKPRFLSAIKTRIPFHSKIKSKGAKLSAMGLNTQGSSIPESVLKTREQSSSSEENCKTKADAEIVTDLSMARSGLDEASPSKPTGGEASNTSEKLLEDTPVIGSIHELWDEAYIDLRDKDNKLIENYEAALLKEKLTGTVSSFNAPSSETRIKDKMARVWKEKMEEIQKTTWKLKFGSHEAAVKDLAKPVISTVKWADEYVSSALSTNPYASIAWAGVSLLLPVSGTTLDYNLLDAFLTV
jgi:hypothetical protein